MKHIIMRDGPLRLTEAQYRRREDEYTGICRFCGAEAGNTEPDARKYRCETCNVNEVYGIEELLAREEIEIV